MVKRNRHNKRYERQYNISCIEPSADAHLEYYVLTGLVAKVLQGGKRYKLELLEVAVALLIESLRKRHEELNTACKISVRYTNARNGDALVKLVNVGRNVKPRVISRPRKHGRTHSRRRALAVGACDMDKAYFTYTLPQTALLYDKLHTLEPALYAEALVAGDIFHSFRKIHAHFPLSYKETGRALPVP